MCSGARRTTSMPLCCNGSKYGICASTTTFKYTDLKLKMDKEGLDAEFKVENVGDFSGSAVPMLFLTFPDNIGEYPEYIFKGFEKILLEPGESKNISIVMSKGTRNVTAQNT